MHAYQMTKEKNKSAAMLLFFNHTLCTVEIASIEEWPTFEHILGVCQPNDAKHLNHVQLLLTHTNTRGL